MLEGFFSHFVLCNKDHMIENVVCFLSPPPLAGWLAWWPRTNLV
jgi:hypothetical protein